VNNKLLRKRKKMLYDIMSCKEYEPMRAKELATLLELPRGKRRELHEVLDRMIEEGSIEITKRGKYQKRDRKKDENVKKDRDERARRPRREKENKKIETESEYAEGTFIGHPKGFGFVEIGEDTEDIFIPESLVENAVHLDKVRVLLSPSQESGKRRREGSVVKVLEHGISQVVGTYQRNSHFGFVIADNAKFSRDIFVPMECSKGAVTGDKVIVSITSYGSKNKSPEGKVTEILGHFNEAGVDVLSIARGYDLPMEFPEKVKNQAERVKEQLIPGDFDSRMDLRDWTIVTIDGEDAKDLDDGVSLTKEGDLYHLGVHIADVTNYVQYNSALDREALKRGTSVYLVDRVIPMLPPRLSNGICSLNQGEDRLALSCLMDIDESGTVVSHQIAETVIRVNRRMTYTNVRKILEGDESVAQEYEELVPLFFLMREVSGLLRKRREKRGAIDFDFPESKIVLNSQGRPVDIYPYEQNTATKIIEDFMLIANETVAEEYCRAEIPFVYRVHEEPDEEKMEAVLQMIHNFGIPAVKSRQRIHPKEIQKILKMIEGTPEEPLFSRLLLRSMKQAKYTPECIGHFGLAARYYCHFTSPIRRYPDLQIHRIIKETIRGKMDEGRVRHYQDILEEVSKQSSAMERRAEEVERETDKLKKAEYMAGQIGCVFQGIISGVTEWGIYVELPNTVEGLVHVNTLRDDYYVFDKEHYRMVGDVTKKSYELGQKVTVRVEDADMITKTVDFVLAKETEEDENYE
jgi:ribonuclease R